VKYVGLVILAIFLGLLLWLGAKGIGRSDIPLPKLVGELHLLRTDASYPWMVVACDGQRAVLANKLSQVAVYDLPSNMCVFQKTFFGGKAILGKHDYAEIEGAGELVMHHNYPWPDKAWSRKVSVPLDAFPSERAFYNSDRWWVLEQTAVPYGRTISAFVLVERKTGHFVLVDKQFGDKSAIELSDKMAVQFEMEGKNNWSSGGDSRPKMMNAVSVAFLDNWDGKWRELDLASYVTQVENPEWLNVTPFRDFLLVCGGSSKRSSKQEKGRVASVILKIYPDYSLEKVLERNLTGIIREVGGRFYFIGEDESALNVTDSNSAYRIDGRIIELESGRENAFFVERVVGETFPGWSSFPVAYVNGVVVQWRRAKGGFELFDAREPDVATASPEMKRGLFWNPVIADDTFVTSIEGEIPPDGLFRAQNLYFYRFEGHASVSIMCRDEGIGIVR